MDRHPAMFHESLNDALREVIDAMGGPKRVGAQMRPEKTPDAAGRWVLDCLNLDRDARFDPDQVLWVIREGRRVGCHAGARFLMREAGYAEPVPVDAADQVQKLVETIEGASDTLNNALAALERLRASNISNVVQRTVK